VVLGLLLLPFDLDPKVQSVENPQRTFLPFYALCGGCRRCLNACPSSALSFDGVACFDPALCVQYYAARSGALPEKVRVAWGDQLYGCDLCLEACPFFQPDDEAVVRTGKIGAFL